MILSPWVTENKDLSYGFSQWPWKVKQTSRNDMKIWYLLCGRDVQEGNMESNPALSRSKRAVTSSLSFVISMWLTNEFTPSFLWARCCSIFTVYYSPDAMSKLIGKDPDAGKDWGQEEKWTTVKEIVGWHHQASGHEFEQTPGDREWQGSLMCCSPWVHKELDTTQQIKNNSKKFTHYSHPQ